MKGKTLLQPHHPWDSENLNFSRFSVHKAGRGPAQPFSSCQQSLNGLAQGQSQQGGHILTQGPRPWLWREGEMHGSSLP